MDIAESKLLVQDATPSEFDIRFLLKGGLVFIQHLWGAERSEVVSVDYHGDAPLWMPEAARARFALHEACCNQGVREERLPDGRSVPRPVAAPQQPADNIRSESDPFGESDVKAPVRPAVEVRLLGVCSMEL